MQAFVECSVAVVVVLKSLALMVRLAFVAVM